MEINETIENFEQLFIVRIATGVELLIVREQMMTDWMKKRKGRRKARHYRKLERIRKRIVKGKKGE